MIADFEKKNPGVKIKASWYEKNALYAASVTRHGGEAIVLDATSDEGTRAAAFASMDGLLISGGADLHPERYGQPSRGSTTMEPDRDALEHEAWIAAQLADLDHASSIRRP